MTLHTLNSLINRYFPAVLFFAFVLGLLLPGVDQVPSVVLAVILSTEIFFSCFKIELKEVQELKILQAIVFVFARYILLPAIFYLSTHDLLGSYAMAVFLFLLLPAGVSSPVISNILGGNISLSLLILILSSLLAPFMIPGLFATFAGQRLEVNSWELFQALALMVFCPLIAHLPLRRWQKVAESIRFNNSILVIPLLALDLVFAIAKRRTFLFEHLKISLLSFVIALGLFMTLYFLTWKLSYKEALKNKISYAVAAGLNNIVLGTVLAVLYFPFEVGLFMIVASLAWVLALIPFRYWVSQKF